MRLFVLLLLLFGLPLTACAPEPPTPLETKLLTYRFDPPAFVEYSEDLQPGDETVFFIPPECGLSGTFTPPVGGILVIELTCPNGPTVLFLDTVTGSVFQPVSNTDSHFLAWTSDGTAAYLKVDSLGSPKIVRAYADGVEDALPISQYTYDLAAKPGSRDFSFSFSQGLGQGSEMYSAQNDGHDTTLLYSDPFNYLSYARYSPDGKQVAFIKTPDTQTPFSVGELWMMDSDGANPRKLADADSGHGYAANWSPDGKQIAFVMRENPEDENADQSSDALISNIYIVDTASGDILQVTDFDDARAETPSWSPDGNTLLFNVVINGRIQVHIADINFANGSPNPEIKPLETESTCCPAWMRK